MAKYVSIHNIPELDRRICIITGHVLGRKPEEQVRAMEEAEMTEAVWDSLARVTCVVVLVISLHVALGLPCEMSIQPTALRESGLFGVDQLRGGRDNLVADNHCIGIPATGSAPLPRRVGVW